MTDSDELSANAYKLLIQSVVDYAIYMLDPTGRVMSWNPGAERIKGYTADEVVGDHFSRFYTDEDRAAGAPEQALQIATETRFHLTHLLSAKSVPNSRNRKALKPWNQVDAKSVTSGECRKQFDSVSAK